MNCGAEEEEKEEVISHLRGRKKRQLAEFLYLPSY
jgi:hypothetical protein